MNNNKTAVILAAGRGSRLGKYSNDTPKPMTQINEVSIINNLITHLNQLKIEQIVIITGYKYKVLEDHVINFKEKNNIISEIIFIRNIIYDSTNNIYSLWLAKEYLQKGFYLLEADIFCDKNVLQRLITSSFDNIAVVSKFSDNMNGTVIKISYNNKIDKMILKNKQNNDFDYSDTYKTVNFYRIGKDFANTYFLKHLNKEIMDNNTNSYYEILIKDAIKEGIIINPLILNQEKWWEIDTPEDLEYTKKIFIK